MESVGPVVKYVEASEVERPGKVCVEGWLLTERALVGSECGPACERDSQ